MSRCLCLLIGQVEKSLRYQGEKVSAPDRAKIEAQVNTLKEAMQVEDTGRICTQIAELQRAKMVLGQVMYSGAAQTELGGPGQPDGKRRREPRSEDVVEGEYQEI